ncbi:glucokinase [Halobacillus karajensis]|uniref:ROK family transcriptional regulator n=1 Tax=Halobacillus karajensis TaxID=195088 RepID=UPI0008A7DF82|nr:ROK family transcriptional regulator [Halobacillus karajensis]SEH43044.1 glucokinase [Halobacillus karajensis]
MQKGNSAYIKNMNKKLVLKCIRDHEPISRSEISKRIHMSKPSVSLLVENLIQEGWVLETGTGESTISGGRKPVQLVFNPKSFYVIGVDIGGTKVSSGITCLNGHIYAYREFATKDYLEKDILERLYEDVNRMVEELHLTDHDIMGMGIGVPGVTNVKEGIVVDAPSMKWRNFPIRERVSQNFSFPVFVENDVNTSVLGEQWLGAGKSLENIIYIAVGTGIGSGMILNGKLFRGSSYSAGEMGYLVTDARKAKDYQPTIEGYGFLESIASGTSIGKRLSSLKSEHVTAKEAFELRRQGDKDAIEIVDSAIEHLGFGIANYISLFDPELVIIGGGVSGSFEEYEQTISKIIDEFTPKSCQVVPSTFGREAGVVGAVALFLKENESVIQI